METNINSTQKILYGKWIFANNPMKRFFFHLLVVPLIINFLIIPFKFIGDIALYAGMLILSLLWAIWTITAFINWYKKWSDETTQEQKDFSWKISTGTCPKCYQKIPRLATKCPHCTADL